MYAKSNLNFLDKPTFIPARKSLDINENLEHLNKCSSYRYGQRYRLDVVVTPKNIKDKEFLGLPTLYDKKILYALMARLSKKVFTPKALAQMFEVGTRINTVEVESLSQLSREVNSYRSGGTTERIKQSVEKWNRVRLSFNDKYFTRCQSVDENIESIINIRNIKIIEYFEFYSKGLLVRFAPEFMICNASKFSRIIDVKKFNSFNSPISARLYEILIMQYHKKNNFVISNEKLIEKLGINSPNSSRNLNYKIDKAVNNLNPLRENKSVKVCRYPSKLDKSLTEFKLEGNQCSLQDSKSKNNQQRKDQKRVFMVTTSINSYGGGDFEEFLELPTGWVLERRYLGGLCKEPDGIRSLLQKEELKRGDLVAIVRGGGNSNDITFEAFRSENAATFTKYLESIGIKVFIGIGHTRDFHQIESVVSINGQTPTYCAISVNDHIN
jgi:hypothetical protein